MNDDPLAEAILKEYVEPAIREFDRVRPDARDEDAAATRAIAYQIGAGLLQLSRLIAGLDAATRLPEKTGAYWADYSITPTTLDTQDARGEVAAKISAPLPGQYL